MRLFYLFAKSCNLFRFAGVHFASKHSVINSRILSSNLKLSKMSEEFHYPNDSPIILLDCSKAFLTLTDSEKLYAHHLSRASWYGGLITLVQTSPESPLIFVLLRKVFRFQSIDELKDLAVTECGFTEEEFKAFLIYACAVFTNMGNYKGSGDVKFVPKVSKEKFKSFLLKSKACLQNEEALKRILDDCFDAIYSLDSHVTRLGSPNECMTTYLSKNFTKEDSELVKEILKQQKLEAYNMRSFKTLDESGNRFYELRLASVKESDNVEKLDVPGAPGSKFFVSYGDYKELLKKVNECLKQAKSYARSKTQQMMIEKYIESFETGLLEHHIEGSRYWIKDIGPAVESYIGFIETYRDPDGMRGEFEGFVAVVNKEMSKKFEELVQNAEKLLPLLPWPKTYEKDRFLRPDFTSLDVVTFGGSMIPAGINIPNYDQIRQVEGFKNVSLGNVIYSSLSGKRPNYVTDADYELLKKHLGEAFEVNVGIHELLGHGSGKMFKREKDGKFNFDVDNLLNLDTNEKITSWYEDGENYDIKFGSLGSPYEECRAESVALHLSIEPRILEIFGYKDKSEADNIIYVIWLNMCLGGLEGLQVYNNSTKKWTQAHCLARYVILQVLLEAGEGFVNIEKIEGSDGKPDLLFTIDKEKILTVGCPAIAKFLRKLQLYKATADVKNATEFFDRYSKVDTYTYQGRVYPFLEYKDIVVARKKPRRMFVQSNTSVVDGKVVLRNFDATPEGLIQSWMDRFEGEDELEKILQDLVSKDSVHFS